VIHGRKWTKWQTVGRSEGGNNKGRVSKRQVGEKETKQATRTNLEGITEAENNMQ